MDRKNDGRRDSVGKQATGGLKPPPQVKGNMKIQKLLRAVRKASGYGSFHQWEPGMDRSDSNPNRPFKPTSFSTDIGAPNGEAWQDRADTWDGGLGSWDDALTNAKVGTVIDFYVTRVGDELITNIEVWIKSETEAWWEDCGGQPNLITVKP